MPALLLLLACAQDRGPEDPSGWFSEGSDYSVQEPVAFTDEEYNLDGGIGALAEDTLPVDGDDILYAPDEVLPTGGDCPMRNAEDPSAEAWTVTGVVTLHPRFYFKTSGCSYDSDEKYYGSYFIEDDTGGFFVLGDSKVAHFDVGNTVQLKVRGVRTNFEQDMVYAHDVLSVDRTVRPISYVVPDGELTREHIARVVRVEGTVITEKDTFGEFRVEADDGTVHIVSLDVELNRRGVEVPVGSQVRATGPVLLSYDNLSIIIMRVGQLEILDAG
jgi:hypothetical protein